jgi:hypothetical protein
MKATFGLPSGNIIWIKTPAEITTARTMRNDDFSLKKDEDFQNKIAQNYETLISKIPSTFTIEGTASIENISRTIRRIVTTETALELLSNKAKSKANLYQKQGTPGWSTEDNLLDLTFQLGSLSALVLRKKGKAYAQQKTAEEIQSQIGEEITDILYETLRIASLENVNISQSWKEKLEKDIQKTNQRA